MRHLPSLLSLLVLSVAASAAPESFLLTDAAGKASGPFHYENGAKVVIEGRAYTLTRVVPKEDPILQRLKELVVDDLQFQGARMEDLLPVLATLARTKDGQPGSAPFNFAYASTTGDETKVREPAPPGGGDFGFVDFPSGRSEAPVFNLNIQKASVYEVLCTACELTGASFAIENRVVVVRQGIPAAAKRAEAPAGK